MIVFYPLWDTILGSHLRDESVDVDRFELTESIDAEHGLDIVGGVPRRVKHHHAVGVDQVDAQRTGPRRDQEQTRSKEEKHKGYFPRSNRLPLIIVDFLPVSYITSEK